MENTSPAPPLTTPDSQTLETNLHFDENKNTCPHQALVTPLGLIKKFLVDQMADSKKRPELWQKLEILKEMLTRLCHLSQYEIWISGIFTTNTLDPPHMNLCFCFPNAALDHMSDTEQTMFASYIYPSDQCLPQSHEIRTFFEEECHLYLTILLCPTHPKEANYRMRKNTYFAQKTARLQDAKKNPAGFFIFQKGGPLYPHED